MRLSEFNLLVFYVGRIQEWQRTCIPCRCAGRFGKKSLLNKWQPVNLISSPRACEWWYFLQASGSRIEVLTQNWAKNQGIEVTKNRFVPFAELELKREWTIQTTCFEGPGRCCQHAKWPWPQRFFEDVSWFFTFLAEQTMPICETLKGCLWSGLTRFVGLGWRKDPWHHGGFQHKNPKSLVGKYRSDRPRYCSVLWHRGLQYIKNKHEYDM